MGDHKAWNGTAWVRPRFWDGSGWLEYIDPVYDVDAGGCRYEFDADSQGWTRHFNGGSGAASWAGGEIYSDAVPGVLGYTYLRNDATVPGGPTDGDRRIYASASVRVISAPGTTQPDPIECYIMLERANQPQLRLDWDHAPGTDSGYVARNTPTGDWTAGMISNTVVVYADGGSLSGYGAMQLRVQWVRIIDADTGQVLQILGDPGWEPYARTTDGRWV